MAITISNRIAASVAGAVLAVGLQALVPAAAARETAGRAAPGSAVRYWTTARMTAALRAAPRPAAGVRRLVRQTDASTAGAGLRWSQGGAVAAADGKVFFTLGSEDYACSGALVGRGSAELVVTAAHCVNSGPGHVQWATNWVFVPDFSDGQEPYGEYTARRFFVAPGWTAAQGSSTQREQYDVAFVQVTAATLDGNGGVAVPPSGLPIQFAASQDAARLGSAYVFGYPAAAPYTGMYLSYCAGPVTAAGGSVRTACGMTAGDSGGPWLAGFSPAGTGAVAAVTTYKVATAPKVLYGAVLGPQAHALYQRAVSSVR